MFPGRFRRGRCPFDSETKRHCRPAPGLFSQFCAPRLDSSGCIRRSPNAGRTGGRREAAMRKHPAEEKAVRLLKDGLSDEEVAKRVRTTPNHVWAIRVTAGLKPVTEKQQAIARAIIARKRAAEPAQKRAATPGPKTAAKSRARRSSK